MTIDPTAIAQSLFADLEKAWNAGDGLAFAAPFSDETDFVDIRGDITTATGRSSPKAIKSSSRGSIGAAPSPTTSSGPGWLSATA